jgi:hypothetical protein
MVGVLGHHQDTQGYLAFVLRTHSQIILPLGDLGKDSAGCEENK